MRWKSPRPPSGPPLCDTPMVVIVPPVGNGRSTRVSRIADTPIVDRRQFVHPKRARNAASDADPSNVCSSIEYDRNRRE